MRRKRFFSWFMYLMVIPTCLGTIWGIKHGLDLSQPQRAEDAAHPDSANPDEGDETEPGIQAKASHGARSAKSRVKQAEKDLFGQGPGDTGSLQLDAEELAKHNLHQLSEEIARSERKGAADNSCSSSESPGPGPDIARVSNEEWSRLMGMYHSVKAELLSWLNGHRNEIPDKMAAFMAEQIRELRIERPPTVDEPDVAWRGTLVWTQDASGQPLIRMGGGFVQLIRHNFTRARFELARAVAQAWAPCEIQHRIGAQPWKGLTQCLGVEDKDACALGSYSEAGWAVSTGLAVLVSNPGCTVPAFADPAAARCLKKFPLPLTPGSESAQGSAPSRQWREARR